MSRNSVTAAEIESRPDGALSVAGPASGRTATRSGRIEHAVLWSLLVLCIARLWLTPLPSSFWVDEMVTIFVVHHGPGDPSLAVAPQVRDSAYYVLPRMSSALFGDSEIAYRVPSVLAMLTALALIARLAARLIHPGAAWFAAFACLTLPGFNFQADDARPYAFGTCVACASALFLVRWLDNARWRDALLFVAAAALLWRVHLIFWPFYPVLVLYAAVRLARRETSVGWIRAAAVFAVLGALLLPVLWNVLALYRNASAHVIVPPPSWRELKRSLQWPLPLICCGGAWILARFFKWPRNARSLQAASLALILGWWLCDPLLLFAISRLTGVSVFIARYLYLLLPGVGLAAAASLAPFIPAALWSRVSIALGAIVLVYFGQWSVPWPPHDKSGWRTAAGHAAQLGLTAQTPIICPSPFIEARSPAWSPQYRLPGFLYAHLPVYPILGTPYLFPFQPSPDAENYAAALSRSVLPQSHRFLIYGGDHNVIFWRDWFAAQPEFAGWKNRRLGPFGDVDVVVFEQPAASFPGYWLLSPVSPPPARSLAIVAR